MPSPKPDRAPRDLLAKRLLRLERRLEEMAAEISATSEQVGRATAHLDGLVDLVGRLGRVVDIQGSTLSGEESQLERKVGSIEDRVGALAGGLEDAVARLERIGTRLEETLAPRGSRR